jgi:serine/threonine-protein kinase RsbW
MRDPGGGRPSISEPSHHAGGIEEFILEVPNDVSAIEQAVETVMRRCRSCACQQRRLGLNLRVSLTEALANAMRYGNRDCPDTCVRLELQIGPEHIEARVIDQGSGFDPNGIPDPTEADNLTKEGGRGLFLMRELMDEVHYNERGNCVTLVLRLAGSGDVGEAASA